MKILPEDDPWATTFPDKRKFAIVPKQILTRCSPIAIIVYAALAVYRDPEDNTCFPSQATLARNLNISISTVKRALNELCGLGVVKKEIRYNPATGGKTSCLYHLCEPWASGEPSLSFTSEPWAQCIDESRDVSPMSYKQEEINEKNINNTLKEDNEIFDAVCDVTKIDLKCITKLQRKHIQSVVSGLRGVGATPEEIHCRAKRMKERWSEGKVTPKSLLKHWAAFSEPNETIQPEYGMRQSDNPWVFNDQGEAVLKDFDGSDI